MINAVLIAASKSQIYCIPCIELMDFGQIYQAFDAPISERDCGAFCSPYNEYGIPFCCDISLAVPSAYYQEWSYLQTHTDQWQIWRPTAEAEKDYAALIAQTPDNQVLITCKGHLACDRHFRSLACRAFPFYPYLNSRGELLGLSYYWEYRFRCWIISHLDQVSARFRDQCLTAFLQLFSAFPAEQETFYQHSAHQRQQMIASRRRITLLHHDGAIYSISPRDERLHPIAPEKLPKYGVYALAAQLPFVDGS